MKDSTINLIESIIDYVFEKHCYEKEVAYQIDELVCDDLIKMREELKAKLLEVLKYYFLV